MLGLPVLSDVAEPRRPVSEFSIRPASAEDFATAIDWAAAEGWNPGLDDLEAFHATDPGGFLLGWRDGEPIGSISVVRYGDGFGFLGFYIVRPDQRGRGYGWTLWQAGMARLAGRTVGLDGVVAQQANYRKSGFVLADTNVRHAGVPALAALTGSSDVTIVGGSEVEPAALQAYDRSIFPAPRDRFTRAWALCGPGGARRTSRVALRGGRIVGYGTIRACRLGHKVGPLFADTAPVAEALFVALCRTVPAVDPVALDTPLGNPAAVDLARRAGLAPVFETARMYAGAPPGLPTGRTFGVTTFELG